MKYLFLAWTLIISLSGNGQCALKDTLWNSIKGLADNRIPVDEQLPALLHFQSVLSQCKTIPDSVDAYLLQRIGVMYFLKSDFEDAVRVTLSAIGILQQQGKRTTVNPAQKIKCFRNLNIYYDSLGMADKKEEATDSAIITYLNSKIRDSLLLYSICDKIQYLLGTGDYLRCVQYASLGQNLAAQHGFSHSDIIKRIFSWEISALLLLKDYTAVANELKNKLNEYSLSGKEGYLGNIYALWGNYYIDIVKPDSALYFFKKSFQCGRAAKDDPICSSALNNTGYTYFKYLNNNRLALLYYFKAIPYSDPGISVSILTNIANVFVAESHFDSAFYYFQKAFDQIHPGSDETLFLTDSQNELMRNYAEYLATLILDKADARLEQFQQTKNPEYLDRALKSYKTADLIMDKIKRNLSEMQSRLFWRKSIRRLYEHAVQACWLSKNADQGFYFFEKSRAVLLDDQLKEEMHLQKEDLQARHLAKNQISSLETALDTMKAGSRQYAVLQSSVMRHKEALDRQQADFRKKDPLYFARSADANSVTITGVRNTILKDHSAVVEIFNGDSSVFMLTITNGGSLISKIDKPSFDSLSRLYMKSLSDADDLNQHFDEFTSVSESLYRLLFPDIALPAGRIIISPDGSIFPFDALIMNKKRANYYMLNEYAISYTYSARFLLSEFNSNYSGRPGDFMGTAPVQYAPYMNLASLAGSDISLREIKARFGSSYISTDSAATRADFLKNFSNYRIVQIYSHASYTGGNNDPVLYFADSSLQLSGLLPETAPATRLIVLTACETALGKDNRGEGVFSFSRQFATLGIPASVSNLWSVDNSSTYRITELFYKYIAKGIATDLALQQAKLEFIKTASLEKSLPFYWASPILTGKSEAIRIRPSFLIRDILLILGLIGIFILIWFKRS